MNPFDRLAPFYDWEHEGYLDDLPLYRGLAGRVGGPILEVACGSGRLLLPLARAGYELVGLDSSEPMLGLLEKRLAEEPALADRVRLVHADLRDARLGRKFKLIVLGLDSFGLLVEQRDQVAGLATLHRHLHQRGLLVLDVANGNLRGGEPVEETILHVGPCANDARQIARWVLRRTDHAAQLDRLTYLYDETDRDGLVRRTSVDLSLRYFGRFELELLLERAGLELEALFGDYDLTPYRADSQRLIALAHVR